jgi:phenylpropionate dioxygenase-like ring-hydroxylating dioxygenase large terminal subunit
MNKPSPIQAFTHPDWARTLTDPAAFAHEQAQLAKIWTLLGLTVDIPNDRDWFRATLGGRSVFVQRFGNELRGFENLCAHRQFPLRNADKGNGVMRCAFHHWQYNKDGLAVGIPMCETLYGMTPRELNARLNPVEIATCGSLIFGRFPTSESAGSLEQFLGDGYPILNAMTSGISAPIGVTRDVAANWKLCFQITLDDYHIVAVHGNREHMKDELVNYFRFGQHSACFETESVALMAAQCRDGSYRPREYRTFQFFPSMLVSQFNAAGTWYVAIQQYIPVACGQSRARAWAFPAPFAPEDKNWRARLLRRIAEPWIPLGMRYQWPKVMEEDHAICEKWQSVAHQTAYWPILGKHEQRIVWFEDVYHAAVAPQAGTPT